MIRDKSLVGLSNRQSICAILTGCSRNTVLNAAFLLFVRVTCLQNAAFLQAVRVTTHFSARFCSLSRVRGSKMALFDHVPRYRVAKRRILMVFTQTNHRNGANQSFVIVTGYRNGIF
jgi:hypothetical protein